MNGGTPRKNELTNDEIKKVLKEAYELGAKTWYIADDGEPLLLKEIDDLIDYANKLGMWVVLATNGELLTEKRATDLKTKNISIITKFNAFDKEIFDHLVQHKSTFVNFDGLYLPRGAASLIKAGYNQSTPTRAGIETVVTTKNISEIPKVYEFAEKHNLYSNIEMMLPIGRARQHQKLIPTDKNIEELYNRLDMESNKCYINDKKDLSHYAGIDCSMRIKYSLYTNSCGDVYLCFSQHPKLSTGMNVRDFTLKDIVTKRKFPEIPIKCACAYFSEN